MKCTHDDDEMRTNTVSQEISVFQKDEGAPDRSRIKIPGTGTSAAGIQTRTAPLGINANSGVIALGPGS